MGRGDKIGSLLQAIGIMGVARLSGLWRTNVQCYTAFSRAVSCLYQAYREIPVTHAILAAPDTDIHRLSSRLFTVRDYKC
jgi:hypothetical protein